MQNFIGKSLGRYHILEKLGEGGMAIVYKAYDTHLENEVAVKVIRLDNLPRSAEERALKRFEREAKEVAKLDHPNIVKITDYGEYEGSPYLVMPYLPGGTLKQYLQKKGRMDPRAAARILVPIADALAYAHRQKPKLVHRDVKPSNILLTLEGRPMLTDFGVAKVIDPEMTLDLTAASAAVGTPEYMAPEQVVSKTVDHRADIYALGVVFYEMVTGRRPYEADTPMAVLVKHASAPLPRPKDLAPDLPDEVEYTLLKALAKQPEDRYSDMTAFANALERLTGGMVADIPPTQPLPKPEETLSTVDQAKSFATVDQLSLTEKPVNPITKISATAKPRTPGKWARIILITAGIIALAILVLVGITNGWFTPRPTQMAAEATVITAEPILSEVPESEVTESLGATEPPLAETDLPIITPTSTPLSSPIQTNFISLEIPSLGKSYNSEATYGAVYDTLFIGINGNGDWPHCSGSINRIEITSLASGETFIEEFLDPAAFLQVGDTVYIKNNKAVFMDLWMNGDAQFVYRPITPITGEIVLRVIGQVDSWENNCGIYVGVADHQVSETDILRKYPGVQFGFFGGGCPVKGPLIYQPYIDSLLVSDGCSFTSNGAPWFSPQTEIEVILRTLSSPTFKIGTYQVDECMSGNFSSGLPITIEWKECVNNIEVQTDGSLRVNFSWHVTRIGSGQLSESQCVVKYSDEQNTNMYMMDNLGNRYDHIETGATETVSMICESDDYGTASDYFIFPPVNPQAETLVFIDDDNGLRTDEFSIDWH